MSAPIYASLQGIVPDDVLALVYTHVLSPSSPLRRNAALLVESAAAYATPLLDAESSSTIVPLLSISATLAVALLILVWIYRMIAFWTRLAMRAVFWGVVFAVAATVYQRGIFNCITDAYALVGHVIEYGAFVKDIWVSEYERWEAQAEATRAARR